MRPLQGHTGGNGGTYVWASEAAMRAYMASDLRRSIASVYEVDGAPRVEVMRVVDELRS